MEIQFFKKKEDNQSIGVTKWIRTLFNEQYITTIPSYLAMSGQELHKAIEQYFKYKLVVNNSVEFKQFLIFAEDNVHLEPYMIEELICTDYLKWRGIVDMVYVDENEQFWLYDWKRSRGHMYDVSTFPTDSISCLEFSLLNSYILQLNIYRIILESEYDMNIKGMKLVCFHPSLESYKVITIPRLSSNVESEIVALRLSEIN